ncbi:hypothetical protein SAMN05444521_0190 [Streptomyces sp. 3214.6]|nr:hypothetical protein SAMN05444521_0190 [Streptomyces sp. 3214.6]
MDPLSRRHATAVDPTVTPAGSCGPNVAAPQRPGNPLDIHTSEQVIYQCTLRWLRNPPSPKMNWRRHMNPGSEEIHQSEDPWSYTPSTPTRSASRIGDAWVMQGVDDYDLEDLNALRRRFPGRRVTLDGDVITVWPPFTISQPSPAPRPPTPHPHAATSHTLSAPHAAERGQPVCFPHPIPATSHQPPQQHHQPHHQPASHPIQAAASPTHRLSATQNPPKHLATPGRQSDDEQTPQHIAHPNSTAKSQHQQAIRRTNTRKYP